MPADILLYALVAAGLIFWLRSILGTRDEDNEMDKPKSLDDDHPLSAVLKGKEESNVVKLGVPAGPFVLPAHVRVDNKTTENTLIEIQKNHPSFDLEHFAQGAEGAFSMIVEAFAAGDVETLENLLASDVFEAFEGVIEARKEAGETVETEIKAVEKMDITEVQMKEDMIFITVRFSARETCVIRDKDGQILSGNPDDTTKMVDVWVFGRSIETQGPEWHLYETRDDEIEEHKTPIPEGGKKKKSSAKKKSDDE